MNTGEMLDELAKVGKPRLMRHDRGWVASVELPTPEGVSAEVRSDFGHPSHKSALTQLLARLGDLGRAQVSMPGGSPMIEGCSDAI